MSALNLADVLAKHGFNKDRVIQTTLVTTSKIWDDGEKPERISMPCLNEALMHW